MPILYRELDNTPERALDDGCTDTTVRIGSIDSDGVLVPVAVLESRFAPCRIGVGSVGYSEA
jgi:hypothetical protein